MIGVPLLKGRFFEPHDTVDAPGVVIVNESLARREWPNGDAIGQRITTSVRFIGPMGAVLMPPTTKYQVVGVVADLKNATPVRSRPSRRSFSRYRQFSFRGFNLVVKGQGDAGGADRRAFAQPFSGWTRICRCPRRARSTASSRRRPIARAR